MRETLSAVAGVLMIAGFVPYIRAILRGDGDAKPSKASWIIWTLNDTILAAGMYAAGALNGQILGAITGAWTVVLLSLKYGTPGWTRLDKLSLIGASAALLLWVTFRNPMLGIIMSASMLIIGSIPTIVSAWENPRRENRTGWMLWWLSCVFAVLAIPQWTFADAAQPMAFFTIETTMMIILFNLLRWRKEEGGK